MVYYSDELQIAKQQYIDMQILVECGAVELTGNTNNAILNRLNDFRNVTKIFNHNKVTETVISIWLFHQAPFCLLMGCNMDFL